MATASALLADSLARIASILLFSSSRCGFDSKCLARTDAIRGGFSAIAICDLTKGKVGAAAVNIGRPPWTAADPRSSPECPTKWNCRDMLRVKHEPPHLRRRLTTILPQAFVSEKEPWTRTESPDRRRRSRAQSRRWSARQRAMPSSKRLRVQAQLRKQDLPSRAAREGAATVVMSSRGL